MPQALAKVTKHIIRKKGKATGLHERSRDAAKLRKASAREERVHRSSAAKTRAEELYLHRVVFFQAALQEHEAGRDIAQVSVPAVAEDGGDEGQDSDEQDEDSGEAKPDVSPDTTMGAAPVTAAAAAAAAAAYSTQTLQSWISAYISTLAHVHPSHKSYVAHAPLSFTPKRPSNRPTVRTAAEEKARERQRAAQREFASGFWCPDVRDEAVRTALREWSGNWSGLHVVRFVRVDSLGTVKESTFPPRGGG